jgi:hypothetical protein
MKSLDVHVLEYLNFKPSVHVLNIFILFLLLIQNKIQTSKRICSGMNQENISSTSSLNTADNTLTRDFLSIDIYFTWTFVSQLNQLYHNH